MPWLPSQNAYAAVSPKTLPQSLGIAEAGEAATQEEERAAAPSASGAAVPEVDPSQAGEQVVEQPEPSTHEMAAGDEAREQVAAVESPVYVPATQSGYVESSHALRSGDPSVSAEEVARDPLDVLIAATHASSGFSATHDPTPVVPAQQPEDLRETYIYPLQHLFDNLRATIDDSISSYKQHLAAKRLASFKSDIMKGLEKLESSEDLKDLVDFCLEDYKSVQLKGVSISGFQEVLARLSDLQNLWVESEVRAQPRLPHSQIAAVDKSIKELRGRLVHCRDAVETEEDSLRNLNADEAGSDLATKEAQLTELEMAIRDLREQLASIRDTKETTLNRLEGYRQEITQGEQELVTLNSQAQTLRSSKVEAPAEAQQTLKAVLNTVSVIHSSFSACIEKL